MSDLSFEEKKLKLKRLLALCSEGEQLKFKKIYSNFLEKTPSEADINLIIDGMSVREINQGLMQVQNTHVNNMKK